MFLTENNNNDLLPCVNMKIGVPEMLQKYPEQQHPLSYTRSPWNESLPEALTPARGRRALQPDSYFTLWKEKMQLMNMEWDAFVPWAGNESLGWSEFIPSCYAPSCCLPAWSEQKWPLWTGCKLVWVTLFWGHILLLLIPESYFFFLNEGLYWCQNTVIARHIEDLTMQSSITLPLLLTTVIIVLLAKNLKSQKKFTKYKNSLLLFG